MSANKLALVERLRENHHTWRDSIDRCHEAADALEAVLVEPVAPGMKQLIAQLNDDQKWTVSEQQQFAEFLKRFPNESSQGIISLGDAWKYGKACAAPQEPAVNAELLEALKRFTDCPGSICDADFRIARAAIAKAGGAA